MVWFAMFRWKHQNKTTYILLTQHFSDIFQIFDPPYLKKFSSKHSKPCHFLDQLFMLFPLGVFIYTFEVFWKSLFSAYKGLTIELKKLWQKWSDFVELFIYALHISNDAKKEIKPFVTLCSRLDQFLSYISWTIKNILHRQAVKVISLTRWEKHCFWGVTKCTLWYLVTGFILESCWLTG